MIHDPEGSLYHSVPLDRKRAEGILRWLEENNYYYEVFSDEAIFTPQNGRELLDIELDRLKSANPEADLSRLELAAEQQLSQNGYAYISSYTDLFLAGKDVNVYNILAFLFIRKSWKRAGGNLKMHKILRLSLQPSTTLKLSIFRRQKGWHWRSFHTSSAFPFRKQLPLETASMIFRC